MIYLYVYYFSLWTIVEVSSQTDCLPASKLIQQLSSSFTGFNDVAVFDCTALPALSASSATTTVPPSVTAMPALVATSSAAPQPVVVQEQHAAASSTHSASSSSSSNSTPFEVPFYHKQHMLCEELYRRFQVYCFHHHPAAIFCFTVFRAAFQDAHSRCRFTDLNSLRFGSGIRRDCFFLGFFCSC